MVRPTTKLTLLVVLAFIIAVFLISPARPRRNLSRRGKPVDAAVLKSGDRAQEVIAHPGLNTNPILHTDILPPSHLLTVDDDGQPVVDASVYREIFSNSTAKGTYSGIYFGGTSGFNAAVIPHPAKYDSWIVVAQKTLTKDPGHYSSQLLCDAGFLNGVLLCSSEPVVIPVAGTQGKCKDDLGLYNFQWGPRDVRIFYGPDAPYILYGAHSAYTCLGMYMQDFRMLNDAFRIESVLVKDFMKPTEIQRPPPFKDIEKNFFVFWDSAGEPYVHTDIAPKRVFAKLSRDGSVGPNLATLAERTDDKCMARYMPQSLLDASVVQQSTNSLAITLCKRSDTKCLQTAKNTFVITIFHYKTTFGGHSIYESYVMLFQQSSPFQLHAISTKPLWLSGRNKFSKFSGSVHWEDRSEKMPENHSEMFYVRSMSWRTHGQKYHGYLDDLIFLAFGIEDSRSGVIDVVASDLLQDLGLC